VREAIRRLKELEAMQREQFKPKPPEQPRTPIEA
jgi:hypothetical protein